jgi:RNA polymerase sigma factor (TIGR02999 family)
MNTVTKLLNEIAEGDARASEELLPVVYDELRKLAAARMSAESDGHTLQATALVHEAYLRLVRQNKGVTWNGRAHFFGAAAKTMRRILVEHARQTRSQKRGGDFARQPLEMADVIAPNIDQHELLALDEALSRLAEEDPPSERIVELRFFAGLSNKEAAEILGISPRKADMLWSFARAWLRKQLGGELTDR